MAGMSREEKVTLGMSPMETPPCEGNLSPELRHCFGGKTGSRAQLDEIMVTVNSGHSSEWRALAACLQKPRPTLLANCTICMGE